MIIPITNQKQLNKHSKWSKKQRMFYIISYQEEYDIHGYHENTAFFIKGNKNTINIIDGIVYCYHDNFIRGHGKTIANLYDTCKGDFPNLKTNRKYILNQCWVNLYHNTHAEGDGEAKIYLYENSTAKHTDEHRIRERRETEQINFIPQYL